MQIRLKKKTISTSDNKDFSPQKADKIWKAYRRTAIIRPKSKATKKYLFFETKSHRKKLKDVPFVSNNDYACWKQTQWGRKAENSLKFCSRKWVTQTRKKNIIYLKKNKLFDYDQYITINILVPKSDNTGLWNEDTIRRHQRGIYNKSGLHSASFKFYKRTDGSLTSYCWKKNEFLKKKKKQFAVR